MHDNHTTDDDESDCNVTDSLDDEDEGADEEKKEDDDGRDEKDKVAWWRRRGNGARRCGYGGKVVDPRARWVQEWNRVFLLVCATGLFVDPLFFYALSISDTCMCLFVDGWFAVTVTVLRCMTDALHLWNMWLQFRMANRPFAMSPPGSGLTPRTTLRSAALRYLRAKRGFFFDLFVILPLPQVSISLFLIFTIFTKKQKLGVS